MKIKAYLVYKESTEAFDIVIFQRNTSRAKEIEQNIQLGLVWFENTL